MNTNQPIVLIGDKYSNPLDGIASSPSMGIAHIRNLDVSTYPGTVRLNNLLANMGGSISNLVTWQRKDPLTGWIWAIDVGNILYVNINGIVTNLGAHGSGLGLGLEIWKSYLIITTGSSLSALALTSSSATGTISSSGTAVTGSGTTFTTEFTVGDLIVVSNQLRKVTVITDNTHLTVNSAFSSNLSGSSFARMRWTDNFVTLTSASESYRPMYKSIDDRLYIGHGRWVASISESTTFDPSSGSTYTFTDKAITLADNYEVRAIRDLGSFLMLGTGYSSSTLIADVFPYNRSNLTLGIPIKIAENGVKSMLTVGNRLYVLAGVTGKMFITDTSSVEQVVQIPNYLINLDGGKALAMYPDSIMYHKAKIFFGIGHSDSLSNAGVWSYNPKNGAIQLENTISTGNDGSSATLLISSLCPIDTDTYVAAWRDSSSYGIDKIDNTLRYTSYSGYIDSRLAKVGLAASNKTTPQLEMALVKPLVSGQGVRIKWRKDLTSSFTTLATVDYATYGGIQSKNISAATLTNLVFVQIRVELTTGSSNLTPELQSILLIH